jgi:tetratricopeptide (TPR) repeat protein
MRAVHAPVGISCLILLCAVVWAQDTVVVKNGAARTGRILRDDYRGIQIRLREIGATVEVAPASVVEVRYGRAPRALGDARELLKAESYDSARGLLLQVLADRKLDGKIRQYAFVRLADCHLRLRQRDQAAEVYEQLLRENPRTRFLLDVAPRLADLHIDLGWPNKVKKMVLLLAPVDRLRAQLIEIRVLEAKDPRGALLKYQTLSRHAGPVGAEAHVGWARMLRRLGLLVQAEREPRNAIMRTGEIPGAVFAQAHLVIGNTLLAKAEKEADESGMKQALFSFLRVPTMYGGNMRSEPEALYRAGYCFERLENLRNHRREAVRWYSQAVSLYGKSSAWGSQAERRMQNVR